MLCILVKLQIPFISNSYFGRTSCCIKPTLENVLEWISYGLSIILNPFDKT